MRTVQQIMAEDNVGERRAYAIRREESAREALRQPASQSLKEGLLLALLNGGKCDAKDLAKRVQRMGFAEAEHGVVHVIWSLQKDQLVKFYETKKSGITGITLTPQGYAKARALSQAQIRESNQAAHRTSTDSLVEITSSSPVNGTSEIPPANSELPPAEAPGWKLADRYPAIHKLVTRKARVEEAAKLLEEAGLIDQAANALESVSETDLEVEVIALVRELLEE